MTVQHTVRTFNEDLRYFSRQIGAMGGFAERMVDESIKALVTGDVELARKVVADDMFLDEREREIGEKVVTVIARRQPMAIDLREIIGAIRISGDLERVGDLAKNIAKRVMTLSDLQRQMRFFRGLDALSELVQSQLKDVLDAYAVRSSDSVARVRNRDQEIDAIYTSLFRELLTYMMEDPRNITPCTHLIFCAKNLERMGDHATNIAETVYYIITGNAMPLDRVKDDKSHQVSASGV